MQSPLIVKPVKTLLAALLAGLFATASQAAIFEDGEARRAILELRQRVDLPARTRYRLVGVGLANFRGHDDAPPQPGLFDRDEDDDA